MYFIMYYLNLIFKKSNIFPQNKKINIKFIIIDLFLLLKLIALNSIFFNHENKLANYDKDNNIIKFI